LSHRIDGKICGIACASRILTELVRGAATLYRTVWFIVYAPLLSDHSSSALVPHWLAVLGHGHSSVPETNPALNEWSSVHRNACPGHNRLLLPDLLRSAALSAVRIADPGGSRSHRKQRHTAQALH
jgi:hypothetical protein